MQTELTDNGTYANMTNGQQRYCTANEQWRKCELRQWILTLMRMDNGIVALKRTGPTALMHDANAAS